MPEPSWPWEILQTTKIKVFSRGPPQHLHAPWAWPFLRKRVQVPKEPPLPPPAKLEARARETQKELKKPALLPPAKLEVGEELNFNSRETAALSEEVAAMLEKKAIIKVPDHQEAKGFHSQLFCVPKKDGGTRPIIINLKALNQSVHKVHFKMKGINMLKDMLKRGDWLTKVDLKDAYFMIPIAPYQRRLLHFKWQGSTYQFTCLPFGLSSAPWVFTKTTKPVMAILRSLGLRMIIYIDDILLMAETKSQAQENTAGLVFCLENLGFIINQKKSVLDPGQGIEFLGFTVNSLADPAFGARRDKV